MNLITQLVDSLTEDKYKITGFSGNSFQEMNLSVNLNGDLLIVVPFTRERIEECIEFGRGLSETSRVMYCPCLWHDEEATREKLIENAEKHQRGEYLVYLMLHKNKPIGWSWLRDVSKKVGDDLVVPILGEGIIDAYQGRGLGAFTLDMLTNIVEMNCSDAVELTVDVRNNGAKKLYESRGYEQLGIIKKGFKIDFIETMERMKGLPRYRNEMQMALIFGQEREVLDYLELKRKKADLQFQN